MPLTTRRRRRHHARQPADHLHRAADVRRERVPTCRTQQLIAAKAPIAIWHERPMLRLDLGIRPTDRVQKGDLTDAIKRVEIVFSKLSDVKFISHKSSLGMW